MTDCIVDAKQLGMIPDIGKDPTGERYALLNAFYFISFAPFSESASSHLWYCKRYDS